MDMFWKQLPCYGFLSADTVKALHSLNWIAAILLLHSQKGGPYKVYPFSSRKGLDGRLFGRHEDVSRQTWSKQNVQMFNFCRTGAKTFDEFMRQTTGIIFKPMSNTDMILFQNYTNLEDCHWDTQQITLTTLILLFTEEQFFKQVWWPRVY